VNVITKSGASIGGASVTAETGTLGTHLARASVGRVLPNGLDVALSGTYEHSNGVSQLYFPAFDSPATNNGIAQGLDGEGVKQLYGRVAFKDLTVTAMYGNRQRDVPTASAGTQFNAQSWREQTTDRHALVDAAFGHSFGATRVNVRLSFDRYSYDATYPFVVEPDGTPTAVARVSGLGSRWSASTGLTRALAGRQTVRAGFEFIDNVHQNQSAIYVDSPDAIFDIRHSSKQEAVYVQDEIKLGRWFIVNAGLRYDAYEQFTRVTPRAALILLPSSTQSVKYLYGSAFRAPNEYELNTYYFGDRIKALRPESIDTHELVWERYINDRLRTSVSTYWYKADRLITPIFDDSTRTGSSFINQGQVRAKGLELEAQIRLKGESRVLASYAFQKAVDQQTLEELPNSPHHVLKARISLPGLTPHSFLSIEGQYLSSRATIARDDRADGYKFATSVPGAATVNINYVAPIGHSWEISGGIRNLFNNEYLDPVSGNEQAAIQQNGITARIGLTWKLGK
jgi:outer membrane receptor for ferrienterochelin and colicins